MLENLLSSAAAAPAAQCPGSEDGRDDTGKTLTMRDAMVQHRANPACAGCHARMDPIGFAMENFDAMGRWRDRDGGSPIDASGVFPGGEKFDGMAGLKAALLSHPEEFVSTVAEKLLMYAIGRNVQYFDEPAVRAIVREAARNNYTFASLVLGVVKSAPFQMREAQAAENRDAAANGADDSRYSRRYRMTFVTKKSLRRTDVPEGRGRHPSAASAGCHGPGAVRQATEVHAAARLYLHRQRRDPGSVDPQHYRRAISSFRRS